MDPASVRLHLFFGAIFFVGALDVVVFALWFNDWLDRGRFARASRWIARTAIGLTAAGLLTFVYALMIEPRRLEITEHVVQTAKLPAGTRVRIVHLSDLHAEGPTHVLRSLAARVNALGPDVVIFTGDTINGRIGIATARQVLADLRAPLGRYAVRGNHDVWYWSDIDLFGGGVATELLGEPRTVGPIRLCGHPYAAQPDVSGCTSDGDAFRVFAYHTPDLIEDLAPVGIDLYLAGHTHGGQVRIPFYGALITHSKFDKKYEMGRYQVEGTTLYVNRGIGSEPGAPVRLLAVPEIAVIDLVGTGTGAEVRGPPAPRD